MSTQFQIPTTIAIGGGERHQCAAHINKLNAKRVLLLCDPGVIQLGFHQDVFDSLQAAHYELAVFDGIQPDPTDKNIIAGVQAVHDHQAEVIIAVGGGSVMDARHGWA